MAHNSRSLILGALFACFLISFTSSAQVGLIHAEGDPMPYLVSLLNATFPGVQEFDASSGTPTAAWVNQFEALLVFSDSDWSDGNALGDLLADYVDNGGGVVVGIYEFITCCIGSVLGGRWNSSSETYRVLNAFPGGEFKDQNNATVAGAFFASHPTVQGVDASQVASEGTTRPFVNITFTEGSYLVLDWSDKSPLIAVKDLVGPLQVSRVDLGFWPSPAEDSGDFNWDGTDPTGTFLKNVTILALQYVLGNSSFSSSVCGGSSVSGCTTLPDFATVLADNPDFLTGYTVTGQTPAAGTSVTKGQSETVAFTIETPSGGSISCSVEYVANDCGAASSLSSPFALALDLLSSY